VENRRFRFVPLLVIVALVLAALTPGLAYAQDDQPQDPPPASEGGAATEEAPPAEEPSGEETPPVEDAPAVEPPVEEPPLEEQPTEEAPVSEGVETLNEEGAVLVDGNGQPVPLASELAAEALAGTDVYFSCDADADGTGGDTCHYSSIQAAVNAFKDSSGTGNIFIGTGLFAENVTISFSEDIGLTGLEGQGSDSTQIKGKVIINTLTSFLLQGVSIYGGAMVSSYGNTAVRDVHITDTDEEEDGAGGLIVGALGSVYMDRVIVTDGVGALVCRGTGECMGDHGSELPPANIIITNSVFSRNHGGEDVAPLGYAGLTVLQSFGNVFLENVKTQNNAGGGFLIAANNGSVFLTDVTSTGNHFGVRPGSNNIMVYQSSTTAPENSETPIGQISIKNSTFSRNYGGLGLVASAPEEISITNSHFDQNTFSLPDQGGDGSPQTGYESSPSGMGGGLLAGAPLITLAGVTASGNDGTGAWLRSSFSNTDAVAQTSEASLTAWIMNSSFNSNVVNGLVIDGSQVMFKNSRACWNGNTDYLGPVPFEGELGPCVQDGEQEGGNPPPQWLGVGPQIVNVFFGGGSGPFNLDRTRDLIYKLWEKQPVEAPDNHLLAQVNLPAYIVPLGGSTGFNPLEQAQTPGGLPQGMTFIGPAFSFNVSDANGNALDALDGKAGISFYLPQGYTVPEDQELVILFFDPESNSWVEIPAQVVDGRVYAYVDKPGTYMLALKPKA